MKKYILQLMDRKEIEVDEDEGAILKEALVKGNVPAYIEIGDTLIASHQIVGVFPEISEDRIQKLNEAPMTEEQKENRRELLKRIREKFNWQNL